MLRRGEVDPQVVDISRQGTFTLAEANDILPIIVRFTQAYSVLVDRLIAKLEAVQNSQTDLIQQIETQINDQINAWHLKVRKLGGVPKGLWIVDFDSGDGFWCWKYPESDVAFWHAYDEGFSARVPAHKKPLRARPTPTSRPSIFRGL